MIIETKMKFTFLLLFLTSILSAQESKIVALLNKKLNQEVKIQFKHPDFQGDTLIIIKPFTINENNILSVEYKKPLPANDGYLIEKQEVALNKIKSFGKDINVFFETELDAVTITQNKIYNSKKQVNETLTFHLLLTPIHLEKNNKELGKTIKKAFSKAGYTIEVNYWLE